MTQNKPKTVEVPVSRASSIVFARPHKRERLPRFGLMPMFNSSPEPATR